jgi:hypothetical protein
LEKDSLVTCAISVGLAKKRRIPHSKNLLTISFRELYPGFVNFIGDHPFRKLSNDEENQQLSKSY